MQAADRARSPRVDHAEGRHCPWPGDLGVAGPSVLSEEDDHHYDEHYEDGDADAETYADAYL